MLVKRMLQNPINLEVSNLLEHIFKSSADFNTG